MIMYYGYRCYNKHGEPIGWLYTHNKDTELVHTDKPKYFHWCKRWKTSVGASKNFDRYNKAWEFHSKGGYLKVEAMPDITLIEATEVRTLQIFQSKEFMSSEQLLYAHEFEAKIKEEIALCSHQMLKATKLVSYKKVQKGAEKDIKLACNEIKAIQKYWYDRLRTSLQLIETRNPQLYQELLDKYLN